MATTDQRTETPAISAGEIERFWSKVNKTDGCWLWTGTVKNGYGILHRSRTLVKSARHVPAHRLSFLLAHGVYPINHACHRCNVPLCVRPDHLYDGDDRSNIEDTLAAGRHHQATKTHCKHGHEFDAANTGFMLNTNGRMRRFCRTCRRAIVRRQDAMRRMARVAAIVALGATPDTPGGTR
jgi:hypothetical protein